MSDITWDDVLVVAPALTTSVVALAARTAFLKFVNESVQASEFGGVDDETFTLARAYLAAHFAAMVGQGVMGAAGPVTSESELGVSRSYAFVPMMQMGMLARTNYGLMFVTLVRMGPAVAGFTA